MSQSKKIVFTPSGLSKDVAQGRTVLSAAHDAGVAIRSLCGGNGNCRQCWVRLVEGAHPKHEIDCSSSHLSKLTEIEQRIQNRLPRFQGMRLACRTQVLGDVVVDVPESSQEHLTTISKKNAEREFSMRPGVKLYQLSLAEATMDDNPSASENVLARLAEQGIEASLNYHALIELQTVIEQAKGEITVAVRQATNSDVSEVVASYTKPPKIVGAAIDIGSTTLALYVYDLQTGELLFDSSSMNPQIKFGEDLMSRVSYVMMNKGGDKDLTQAVRTKLTIMLQEALKQLGLKHKQLLDIVLVGNPIMHHLFFGISPVPLGQAPFTVANREWMEVNAAELNLDIYPATRASFLPLIAGHVGADMAAAYLSEIDTMQSQTSLLVDIGTNAEIMLAKDGLVFATSSPTGPAFEGAEISAGVRASHGAIERIRIDPSTLEVHYKLIGNDAWSYQPEFAQGSTRAIGICGSGIIEVMVCLAQAGLIDKGGLFVQHKAPERFDKVGGTVRFLLVEQGEQSIYIEQTDVRSIQLAKAALYAGVQLLMDYQQCERVEQVLLAGAFGSHLAPDYVADLDLIPGATKDLIHSVGNAAGIGATKALLDVRERQRIIDEVRKVQKIESANEAKFQDYFVEGMKFSVSPVDQQKNTRNRRRRATQ